LLLGITPEAISTEVDLLSLVIDPIDMVAVFFEPNFREVLRFLEPFEDSPSRDDRPEIDNPLVPVSEHEFQYAVYHEFCGHNPGQFLHLIIPEGRKARVSRHAA
jgi:hypothetical protein